MEKNTNLAKEFDLFHIESLVQKKLLSHFQTFSKYNSVTIYVHSYKISYNSEQLRPENIECFFSGTTILSIVVNYQYKPWHLITMPQIQNMFIQISPKLN